MKCGGSASILNIGQLLNSELPDEYLLILLILALEWCMWFFLINLEQHFNVKLAFDQMSFVFYYNLKINNHKDIWNFSQIFKLVFWIF